MATLRRRIGAVEVLENRRFLAADLMAFGTAGLQEAVAQPADTVASSFSFGVEREMKESGEKGGTEDINIGVGELQESPPPRPKGGAGPTEQSDPRARDAAYAHYELKPAFVKSWSTSGDADDRPTEEIAFYYNRIAFNYASHIRPT